MLPEELPATFNTPLGGIFFAQEVILRKYNAKFLSSVVISAVAATVVSRNFLGNVPAFIIPKYQLKSIWEIPMYVVFAFLAGLVAVMFTKFLYKCEDIVDSIKIPEYTKPAIGGIAIGVIGLYYPHIFGVGYPAMETALSGKHAGKPYPRPDVHKNSGYFFNSCSRAAQAVYLLLLYLSEQCLETLTELLQIFFSHRQAYLREPAHWSVWLQFLQVLPVLQ